MVLGYTTLQSQRSGYLGVPSTIVVSKPISPSANSLVLLVIQSTESYISPWAVPVITDSLATPLTWTVIATQADQNSSYGGVWLAWANCPTAQTNMTASVTLAVTDTSQTVLAADVVAIVITGADPTAPIVNIQKGISSTNSASKTLLPIYSGSMLMMASTRTASSPSADTASAGNYLAESYVFGSSYSLAWYGGSTGPSLTDGTSKTLALNTTDSTNAWQYIAFEIAPPHGSVAAGTGIVIGAIAF